jgi:hypothetical protein
VKPAAMSSVLARHSTFPESGTMPNSPASNMAFSCV